LRRGRRCQRRREAEKEDAIPKSFPVKPSFLISSPILPITIVCEEKKFKLLGD